MSGNIVVMLMVAVVIPSMSLCIVCIVIWVKDHVQKWLRNAFAPDVIFIEVTQIATDLVPLMWKLVHKYNKELKIRTFGFDGAYFAAFTAWLWNFAIKYALRKGAQVEYILCEMDEKAKKSLSKLVAWSLLKDYGLRVYVLRDSRRSVVAEHLDKMRTRHPTLFTTLDNNARAMWLEGKHKEGGIYAYNVRYVSPKAMNDKWKKEFTRQSNMLTAIVGECEPLAPSAT